VDTPPLGSNVPTGGNRLTAWLGRSMLRVGGWRIDGEFPNRSKLIIAVAPHSSNIDFVLTIAVIWGLGLKAEYLAKESLFRFPLGVLMRAFGGIPVERDSPHGLVGQMVEQFSERSSLVLGITPEGTRGSASGWKRGFALIAQGSNVPVLPAILNYRTRVIRFGDLITEVGNVDDTMRIMQQAAASGAPRSAHQPRQKI
jgi:1-acyl-sn-glycerol-3-phosphate acyltransferase